MVKLVETIINNRLTKEEYGKLYGNSVDNIYFPTVDLILGLVDIPDMEVGSNILLDAIKNNELIVVIGDIDQDGILGSYCIYSVLTKNFNVTSENIKLVIGTRNEGRGINNFILSKIDKIVDKYKREPDLIITVDHGSTDENNYIKLKEKYKNLKLIVTDHHTVEYDIYPKHADAFINVHRQDCEYPKCISGCVTGFLLMLYTYYKFKPNNIEDLNYLYPYISLSTIGDVMPMKYPINRYIVKKGIDMLNEYLDDNFTMLKDILKLPPSISYKDFNMSITPFINTGNRMNCEEYTLLALVIKDLTKKKQLLDYVHSLNKYRKEETRVITNEVIYSDAIVKYQYGNAITVDSKAMIMGPIAGNISSMFYRPVVCFGSTPRRGYYFGSGRCDVKGISLLNMLRTIQEEHPDVIDSANGHSSACGVTIYEDKLEEFKVLFNNKSKELMSNLVIEYPKEELVLEHSDINMYTYGQVYKLSPYGLEWREPIFRTNRVKLIDTFKIKTFYKLTFELNDGYRIEGMYFFRNVSRTGLNNLNLRDILKNNMYVDILYNISVNYYNSRYSIQLEIIDITP